MYYLFDSKNMKLYKFYDWNKDIYNWILINRPELFTYTVGLSFFEIYDLIKSKPRYVLTHFHRFTDISCNICKYKKVYGVFITRRTTHTDKFTIHVVDSDTGRRMLVSDNYHRTNPILYTRNTNDAIFLDYPLKRVNREIKFHDCIINVTYNNN